MCADEVNVAAVARMEALHLGHLIWFDAVARVLFPWPKPATRVLEVPLQILHPLPQPLRLPLGIFFLPDAAQLVQKSRDDAERSTAIPRHLDGLFAV